MRMATDYTILEQTLYLTHHVCVTGLGQYGSAVPWL